MQRDFIAHLQTWRQQADRVPLLIRGARQVGKSWGIREFGKGFEYFVEINFEKNAQFKQAFTNDIDIIKLGDIHRFSTGK